MAPSREQPRGGVARMPRPPGGVLRDRSRSPVGSRTRNPRPSARAHSDSPESHALARQSPPPAADSSDYPSHLPVEARHLFLKFHHRGALSLSTGHLPAEETSWCQPAEPPISPLPAEDAFTVPRLHLGLSGTCPPPPLRHRLCLPPQTPQAQP